MKRECSVSQSVPPMIDFMMIGRLFLDRGCAHGSNCPVLSVPLV
jgi:hypothetical protein